MNPDDIDEILANEAEITPSPEFLASVMRAVRREATSLPPLKFPWRRALPGFLATFVALARAIWDLVGFLRDAASFAVVREQLDHVAALAAGFGLQWILLAVVVTVVSLALSLKLVGGRNYLRYR
jgi:hypothetical protein